MKKTILKCENDNVAIALEDIKIGDSVVVLSSGNETVMTLTARTKIPYGNKIAVKPIDKETVILKGDYNIGTTLCGIDAGELVHVHNVESNKVNFPPSIIDEILKQMDFSVEEKEADNAF